MPFSPVCLAVFSVHWGSGHCVRSILPWQGFTLPCSKRTQSAFTQSCLTKSFQTQVTINLTRKEISHLLETCTEPKPHASGWQEPMHCDASGQCHNAGAASALFLQRAHQKDTLPTGSRNQPNATSTAKRRLWKWCVSLRPAVTSL
jgi:hypothetical protein